MAFVGQPYVWGGETPAPGFDCSGLVKWAFGQHGIALPKWARSQWDCGVEITLLEAEPADLVFFVDTYDVYAVHGWFQPPRISHVGIYLGDGKMVNANSRRGVSIDTITDASWWRYYHGLRRVIA